MPTLREPDLTKGNPVDGHVGADGNVIEERHVAADLLPRRLIEAPAEWPVFPKLTAPEGVLAVLGDIQVVSCGGGVGGCGVGAFAPAGEPGAGGEGVALDG